MSNLKRVISMLLAAAMIFSMSAIVAYAEDGTTTNQEAADAVLESAAASALASLPNDDVQYAAAYKFDYALGIFEMLEDGYWQKDQVTRGEFATIVAKMIKANTDGYPNYDYSPYTDINASHFAYPAVCYLTDIGILNGDGNSTFRPDEPILVNEATKMVMCAIGFKDACELNGGYPSGYNKFATTQGVYDNLNFSYTSSMTAMQMSQMVRNALEAYIMEKVIYRADGTADAMLSETKTLLTETYKMENLAGTVEGTYFSYFSSNEVGLENEVIIDGVCYQFDTKVDMEALLGYEVNFYYMEDVSGYRRPYIVYCEPRNGKNSEIDVMAKDIVSLTSTQLVYNDANYNERTIQILPTTEVSYNGKPFYDLDETSLKIKEGHVKVVTHDSTSKAAAVIIQEQFDGLFERYNKTNYQIIFQDNMTTKLPEVKFDTVYRTRLTLDGKDIKPEELVKNDAITYTVSKDGEYIRGYVSRAVESGQVSREYTEDYAAGTYKVIELNGKQYFISAYCTKDINTGFSSDFQITYDGRILGTNTSTSNGGNYGYLFKFGTEGGVFNNGFRVKILDKNGKVAEYVSAQKVNTNVDGEVKQRTASEIANNYASYFEDPQVVVFETNTAGEIRTLYIAQDFTKELGDPDDLDFGMYYSGTARYNNNLIANCAINDSTVIFRVPFADRDRDEDYQVDTKEALSNGSYTVDIYDIRNGVSNVIAIKDKEPTTLDDAADTLIVDKFSTAWDEEKQERVLEVSGWSNGELISLKVDEDVSQVESLTTLEEKGIRDLVRGDVIQYNKGSNDYLYTYRVLFNYSLRGNSDNYFEMNQDRQSNYQVSNDKLYTLYGQVQRTYDYFMVETTNLTDKKWFRAYPTTDINLYIYDTEKDEIIIGEPFDIQIGDRVFIRTKYIDQQIDMLVIQ
ncbi:MAG: S-layer homology domain-containing protein [Clostridiales bacterium]|nr:S-layer homology domain-containing protein [Clostridiales bacterium]